MNTIEITVWLLVVFHSNGSAYRAEMPSHQACLQHALEINRHAGANLAICGSQTIDQPSQPSRQKKDPAR
jgi:hypothetical protein